MQVARAVLYPSSRAKCCSKTPRNAPGEYDQPTILAACHRIHAQPIKRHERRQLQLAALADDDRNLGLVGRAGGHVLYLAHDQHRVAHHPPKHHVLAVQPAGRPV